MRSNVLARTLSPRTHEGGTAGRQKPLEELTRAVSTCLLFENTFYESGNDIADRIAHLCEQIALEDVGALAITARNEMKLRHVPLFLARQMARLASEGAEKPGCVSQTLFEVIQRPDELSEFLVIGNGLRMLRD